MNHVYFDHNATTPIDERVLEAMLPYLRSQYGNASSRHDFGTQARKAVDHAREQVAAIVRVQPVQVVFMSGGTEANNLFVKGAAAYLKPTQIAVSSIEHPCVAKPAQDLARQGWKVRRLAVTRDGQVDLADVDEALRESTGLVSVMLANNETGVIQDVAAVSARARGARAWMHTDAVQALGKIPMDFEALGVHAMTVSAHKLYGPKGIDAKRRARRGLFIGIDGVLVLLGVHVDIAEQRQHDRPVSVERKGKLRIEQGNVDALLIGHGGRQREQGFAGASARRCNKRVGRSWRPGRASGQAQSKRSLRRLQGTSGRS